MIAKGPNVLNLHAYTQGQQQYEQSEYPNNSQRPPIENSKSIEDQFDNFIKEINKYDEVLRKVALDIDDLTGSDPHMMNDFYPEFIVNTTYESDQQKKIVLSSDPQMGKVITNLQKTNKILKEEIKEWSMQFSKTTKLSQTLLSENQILRKAITMKNKELLKLIETISNTENQEISDMKENLEILRQENGVLLDHLTKIKDQLKEKREDEERLKKALSEKKIEMMQVEKRNSDIEDREEHLSKTVALMEDSLQQMLKRKKKLEKQKQRLLSLKQSYTRDQSSIQSTFKQSSKDKEMIQKQLKEKFQQNQQQKHRLIELIEEQTENIQSIKEQTRKIQSQIERKENRLQEYNKLNKDLKTRSEQNNEILQKLTKQNAKFVQEEGSLQAEMSILENDVEMMKQELKQFDRVEKQLKENQKILQKAAQENNAKVLTEQKNRQFKEAKDLVKKIFEEKLELSLKEKQAQDWEMKVIMKKQEINELKAQMKEIRSNQSRLAELKSQLSSG